MTNCDTAGKSIRRTVISILAMLIISLPCWAGKKNKVLGEVSFVSKEKASKTAGVWIDGQYVGYVDELKGNKRIFLLPGSHDLSVRQTGYVDMNQRMVVIPGQKNYVLVVLKENPKAQFSEITAQIKLDVSPDRAAVLVDGTFAGIVHDFGGWGRAMLVSPGKHHVTVALIGYRSYETDVDLRPQQKITLKADLAPGSVLQADRALREPGAMSEK